MLRKGVLCVLVLVVVARGAGRAEHGRRRDGPDLRQRDGRLRQLRQHQLLLRLAVPVPAVHAATAAVARRPVATHWNIYTNTAIVYCYITRTTLIRYSFTE